MTPYSGRPFSQDENVIQIIEGFAFSVKKSQKEKMMKMTKAMKTMKRMKRKRNVATFRSRIKTLSNTRRFCVFRQKEGGGTLLAPPSSCAKTAPRGREVTRSRGCSSDATRRPSGHHAWELSSQSACARGRVQVPGPVPRPELAATAGEGSRDP